jgi:hypothetical protein
MGMESLGFVIEPWLQLNSHLCGVSIVHMGSSRGNHHGGAILTRIHLGIRLWGVVRLAAVCLTCRASQRLTACSVAPSTITSAAHPRAILDYLSNWCMGMAGRIKAYRTRLCLYLVGTPPAPEGFGF